MALKKKSIKKETPVDLKCKVEKIKDIMSKMQGDSREFLVVKVGSADRPASTGDIADVQVLLEEKLAPYFKKNKKGDIPIIVTHHSIDFYFCSSK